MHQWGQEVSLCRPSVPYPTASMYTRFCSICGLTLPWPGIHLIALCNYYAHIIRLLPSCIAVRSGVHRLYKGVHLVIFLLRRVLGPEEVTFNKLRFSSKFVGVHTGWESSTELEGSKGYVFITYFLPEGGGGATWGNPIKLDGSFVTTLLTPGCSSAKGCNIRSQPPACKWISNLRWKNGVYVPQTSIALRWDGKQWSYKGNKRPATVTWQ